MVLLITGAIDIRDLNVPLTKIVDVNERLLQYTDSIEYAITHYESISEIIFCENTEFIYDYAPLKKKAANNGKNLEILSFKGDYINIQQKGKGFGEGEIIKYALDKSELLHQCDCFYKLTGRLIVKNMDKILAATSQKSSFIYYPKTIYKISKDHIETYFYKVEKSLYIKKLIDAYQEVDESHFQYLEHVFHERLLKTELRSFNTLPLISGFSGTSGDAYEPVTKYRLMENINYFIGAHNLKQTITERVMTRIFSSLLKIGRLLK